MRRLSALEWRAVAGAAGGRGEALAHLRLLFDDREGLVELRLRDARTGRWSQRFWAASDLEATAAFGIEAAARHDVYVGVLPRTRRGGRRADLPETAAVAWVDLDRANAATALDAGDVPAPSLMVASGSPGHRHLYWRLEEPVALDELEDLNMGLAVRVGGDLHAGDAPRILRLAGTLNHKPPTPTPVLVDRGASDAAAAVRLAELRVLTAPSPTRSPRPRRGSVAAPGRGRQRARRAVVSAKVRALEAIVPAVYVETLTGQVVPGRSRKVRCPLHEDDTPSLHVYETAEEGWFCFGCRRGGSVYDLAAATLGRELRGRGFVELQQDLIDLLVDRTAPSPRHR